MVPAGRKAGYSTELNDRTFHGEDCHHASCHGPRGCSVTLYPSVIQRLCHQGPSSQAAPLLSPDPCAFSTGEDTEAESDGEEVAIAFNQEASTPDQAGSASLCNKCEALDSSSGKKAGKKKRQGRG